MWCDNCCLLLPLRAGAIAWGVVIVIYSGLGGYLLVHFGPYLFFLYPEWIIYGVISFVVMGASLINVVALSNRAYIWTRVCKFIWPFIIIISAVRAIIIIVRWPLGREELEWECSNGGAIWPPSGALQYGSLGVNLPQAFCTPTFHTLYWAWIWCLIIDLGFQMYMCFLNWRFSKRIEHYSKVSNPYAVNGGYYA